MALINLVDLGYCVVECFLCHLAGLWCIIHDFIFKNRVVEDKAKSNGTCLFESFLTFLGGKSIGSFSFSDDLVFHIFFGMFADVSVVISLHFPVEHFSFNI